MKITRAGVDIAKSVLHVYAVDRHDELQGAAMATLTTVQAHLLGNLLVYVKKFGPDTGIPRRKLTHWRCPL